MVPVVLVVAENVAKLVRAGAAVGVVAPLHAPISAKTPTKPSILVVFFISSLPSRLAT